MCNSTKLAIYRYSYSGFVDTLKLVEIACKHVAVAGALYTMDDMYCLVSLYLSGYTH